MPAKVRTLVLSGGLALLGLQQALSETSFSHGEIVETWHSEAGEWRASTYVSSATGGHWVARLDDGVQPSVPDSQVRKAVPYSALDAVQMLDETSLSWVTATVLANGTTPGHYVLDVPGFGILDAVSTLIIRRVPTYDIGDRIRWKHMESNYWVEGTISSVGDGNPPVYNVMLKGHGEIPTPPALIKRFEHFKAGETVQMWMSESKSWLDSCEITQKGQEEDTFEVTLPDGKLVTQSGGFLRKQKKKPASFGQKLYGGQTIEFVDNLTNAWTPGKVLRPGDTPNTYTLIIPMMGEKPNIPEILIRPRNFEIPNETHVEMLETRNGVWMRGFIINATEDKTQYTIVIPNFRVFYDIPEVRVRTYVSPIAGERMEVYVENFNLWAPCDIQGLSDVKDNGTNTYNAWAQGSGDMKNVNEFLFRRVGRVARAGYY